MKHEILVVDDKIKFCKSLCDNLIEIGYDCAYAVNGDDALTLLKERNFKVAIVDIVMGYESGIDILKRITDERKNLPVIMMTGYASIDTAVQSIKSGAFDYIQKPVNFDKLLRSIENAVKAKELSEENEQLRNRVIDLSPHISTRNREMKELLSRAERFAKTDLPVLIVGENGTGKELVADFIHANSKRNAHRIVKINCAAFPDSLLDNELFGHDKGAFTGADATFTGVFERVNNGTLLLDEIGNMPHTIQTKILRTIQNQEIKRIGGNDTIKVNVRFISATNSDLKSLMNEKKFREDLYYRLNTVILQIPPLRERKDDIPILVGQFLREVPGNGSGEAKEISQRVIDLFLDYMWPGNVRELKNVIYYAAAISTGDFIDIDDLPSNFAYSTEGNTALNLREELEKDLIIKILKKTNNNKKKAAEILNMSRNTLYCKLKEYGLCQ